MYNNLQTKKMYHTGNKRSQIPFPKNWTIYWNCANRETARADHTLAFLFAAIAQKLQQMITQYNADSCNMQMFFNDLINFAQELGAEQKRAIAKNLTEEELAIFDWLTKARETGS